MSSFCAGFFSGDLLFEVSGLEGDVKPVPEFVANTFSVLTRGAPTKPSPRLVELLVPKQYQQFALGEKNVETPLLLLGDNERKWDRTIRGASDGYNPASEFFHKVLPLELGYWAFIGQLIVPEFPLFQKLDDLHNHRPRKAVDSNAQQVDFFLPQADLVIEIDGGSHQEPAQIRKDSERNRYLNRHGISTLRLSTSDLRAKNSRFQQFISELRKQCEESPRLQAYKECSLNEEHLMPSWRFDVTASIRLQLAVLAAISHGQLDLSEPVWRLSVSQDFQPVATQSWVNAALDDLFGWLELFARLSFSDFSAPRVVFDADGLHVNMLLFDRPDDKVLRRGELTVQTSAVQDLPYAFRDGQVNRTIRAKDLGISYLPVKSGDQVSNELPLASDLTELCHKVFGHENFRPGQETLIFNALMGKKSLGLMPTGSGKSLCFQLPSLLSQGATVVIVPIKALGRDHAAELQTAGFSDRVVNIDSDMPAPIRDQLLAGRIRRGEIRFAFVSPERFQIASFRELLNHLKSKQLLQMFVVDEVHCLSEWGHDFRPSYLTLPGILGSISSDVPVLGLTATASVNVLRDIQSEFEIPEELVAYEMHRSRTELEFFIKHEFSGPSYVENEVKRIVASSDGNAPPPTHIFSRYVNGDLGVWAYSEKLGQSKLGLRIGQFSGKMPKKFDLDTAYVRLGNPEIPKPMTFEDYKQTVQDLWKKGLLDVIVTTKAFGMGVNKQDVRYTLHAGMPSSMEAFYQEAGRAGRDRKKSFCQMLFKPEADDVEAIFERLRADPSPKTFNQIADKPKVRGDFRRQLWFLSQGLISVEEELALVTRAHELINGTNDETVSINASQFSDLSHGKERLQETLYRLYQMGLIAPWVVTNWGQFDEGVKETEVSKLPNSFKEACEKVAARFQAIDGKFADLSSLERLKAQASTEENWPELYSQLLNWVRRKHLDSRLQSTKNLYDKCMTFNEDEADSFREDLEAFFKVDSSAFQLAMLRDMPQKDVVKTLEELLIDETGKLQREQGVLRKLSTQLARLLEGTQDSPGLNLAAFLFSLLNDEKSGAEAEMRLNAALPDGVLKFWETSGSKLLSLVASHDASVCDLIGEWLVEDSPSRSQLLAIHDSIPARAIETELFLELARELDTVM